ncbi:hypothetical protein BJ508DRAFT_336141 [Ascobolus immersus RN42]|uniref:Uncharacterized protein n=1 Tax=Ascobolus immersus RN42 TaxID=1160509 RepID=A0A3N4HFZ9_ASCIM|nr:hypothetical protein BJ508DRAFT_336141 [Ascobolus immersus RN42]
MDAKVIGSLVKPPPQLRGKENYPGWADSIHIDMTLIDRLNLLEEREEAASLPSPPQQGGRSRGRWNSQEVQNHAQAQRVYEEEAMRYKKKKVKLFAYLYKALHLSIQYQAARFKEEQNVMELWQVLKEQYSARTVAEIVSLYRRLTTMRFRDAEHPAGTVAEYNSRLRQADERLKASMRAIDAKVLRAVMYLEGMKPHFPPEDAMLLRDNQYAIPGPQGLKSLDFHNVMQEMELLMSIRASGLKSGGEASKAFRAAGQRQGRRSSAGRGREKPRGGGHAGSSKEQSRRRCGSDSQVSKPQGQSTGSGPYCEYHKKHGHSSEECKALKQPREVLAKSQSSTTQTFSVVLVTKASTRSVFLPRSYRQLVRPEVIKLADGGIIMAYGADNQNVAGNPIFEPVILPPKLEDSAVILAQKDRPKDPVSVPIPARKDSCKDGLTVSISGVIPASEGSWFPVSFEDQKEEASVQLDTTVLKLRFIPSIQRKTSKSMAHRDACFRIQTSKRQQHQKALEFRRPLL